MVELRITEMANSDLEKYHKVQLFVLLLYCWNRAALLPVLDGALLAALLALLLPPPPLP
jgi:hypothetical protein